MMGAYSASSRSTKSLIEWLQNLGEPLSLEEDQYGVVVKLRTDDGVAEIEFEGGLERMDWDREWLIIGCLVSHAKEGQEFRNVTEMLQLAAFGVKRVLEARIIQLHNQGLSA